MLALQCCPPSALWSAMLVRKLCRRHHLWITCPFDHRRRLVIVQSICIPRLSLLQTLIMLGASSALITHHLLPKAFYRMIPMCRRIFYGNSSVSSMSILSHSGIWLYSRKSLETKTRRISWLWYWSCWLAFSPSVTLDGWVLA